MVHGPGYARTDRNHTGAAQSERALTAPNRMSCTRVTASPFGVHLPMATIHAGMVSNGKKEPPIMIRGNNTIWESTPAVRALVAHIWMNVK